MITRLYYQSLKKRILESNKIIILYGPRQTGKTTLIKSILKEIPLKTLEINADEQKYTEILSSRDLEKMKWLVGGYELLFIDEAQRVPNIGINLKILHDQLPNLKIIVTGSSSFDLANQIQEPLTGRTWTYILYPIGISELALESTPFEIHQKLESLLLYGMYPEIFSYESRIDKIQYLGELSSVYLYKDVLELSNIRHSSSIYKLLQLLAFQVGSLVSINELGASLQMSKETVNSYIDLLEKSFVIFRLAGYSRNLRKEIGKMDKIYFWDLGVRNSLIDDFRPIEARNDVGQLWENFMIAERKKYLAYYFKRAKNYFWRTYTKSEMDYLEESDGEIKGFEFKYSAKKTRKARAWEEAFPESSYQYIHQENYFPFLTE